MKKYIVLLLVLFFAGSTLAGTQLNITIGDTVNAKLASGLVDPKVGGIEVNLNGTTIGYNVGSDAIWAGCYLFDIEGMVNNYKSFCFDVTSDPALSYTVHTAYTIGSDIKYMWGTYYDGVINDAVKAAAFQLAVWEMMHESESYDISSGDFYLEALNTSSSNNNGATFDGLIALTNDYLNSNNWTNLADLVMLDDGTHQPFAVEVPEPATVVLLGLGGLLFGKRRA